jgi:hypothetical protein
MRAQAMQAIPHQSPLGSQGLDTDLLKAMQMSDGLNFAEGTIRPTMLDCGAGYDQMDSMLYSGEYEGQMGIA